MKKTVTVYDPALCCSTGVCGPDVDSSLVRFANDVKFLQQSGVSVTRYNLAQQPGEFVANESVRAAMTANPDCLPLVIVDGEIRAQGAYPERQELLEMVGIGVLTLDSAAVAGSELTSGEGEA